MDKRITIAVIAALILSCLPDIAQGQSTTPVRPVAAGSERNEGPIPLTRCDVRLSYANDAIVDTTGRNDWGYTSGFRFSALWPLQLDPATGALRGGLVPSSPIDARLRRFVEDADGVVQPWLGLAAGQDIFTPKVFHDRRVLKGDRPYAGWLYTAIVLELATRFGFLGAELDMGVTGRYSFADTAQSYVHRTIGSPEPVGWREQIRPGVGAELIATGGYTVLDVRAAGINGSEIRAFDLLFYGETSAGNVLLAQAAGWTARVGYLLKRTGNPINHAVDAAGGKSSAGLRPGGADLFQFYAYLRLKAQLVFHNSLIQGWPDTRNPYAVGIAPLVYEAEGGIVVQPVNLLDAVFSITHVTQETRTGRSDRGGHTYGQLQLGLHFF